MYSLTFSQTTIIKSRHFLPITRNIILCCVIDAGNKNVSGSHLVATSGAPKIAQMHIYFNFKIRWTIHFHPFVIKKMVYTWFVIGHCHRLLQELCGKKVPVAY
jgi:hypothetical protein